MRIPDDVEGTVCEVKFAHSDRNVTDSCDAACRIL
jgi:hypothetical protein